ncbi:hypothetical protein HK100_012278 [Physocladia obscura]|uniref:Uncharacterized protein n=1 Tax=Physocladia obscura TaxID=109957 RepID=A0AAD5T612_9FUNG|nr:hypothetical protein HK100_012278 [Physocladia obscura]
MADLNLNGRQFESSELEDGGSSLPQIASAADEEVLPGYSPAHDFESAADVKDLKKNKNRDNKFDYSENISHSEGSSCGQAVH